MSNQVDFLLEHALIQFLAQQVDDSGEPLLPPTLPFYASHDNPTIKARQYVVVISQTNSLELLRAGTHSKSVEFAIFSSVEDKDARSAVIEAHEEICEAIRDTFGELNFLEAKATINAIPGQQIGFTGWEEQPGEDGTIEDKIVSRERYVFECHLI